MQSFNDIVRALVLVVPAVALALGGEAGALVSTGAVGMFVSVCVATEFEFVWTATVLASGWSAGALVSAGMVAAFVSVCACAARAREKTIKTTLKRFMVLCMVRLSPRFVKPKTHRRARR